MVLLFVILAIKTTNRFDFYVFSDVNLSLLGLEMFIMISHDSHFNDVCLFLYSVFKVRIGIVKQSLTDFHQPAEAAILRLSLLLTNEASLENIYKCLAATCSPMQSPA